MYAQMLTRPDISYSVSVLSKHLNSPTDSHMKQARRMLAYLYHSADKGIVYGESLGELSILGWSDSDYAGDVDNRKSQTGWVFKMNGGAISWRSYQQNCVALSTPEHNCTCLACCLAHSLRQLDVKPLELAQQQDLRILICSILR